MFFDVLNVFVFFKKDITILWSQNHTMIWHTIKRSGLSSQFVTIYWLVETLYDPSVIYISVSYLI